MTPRSTVVRVSEEEPLDPGLDGVFFALSDPVRRRILDQLEQGPCLVSELAAPFEITLQSVSRHIQVLVRAGLVQQARTGRISLCSLDVAPMVAAATWMNRYTQYWESQFEALGKRLEDTDADRQQRKKTTKNKPTRS